MGIYKKYWRTLWIGGALVFTLFSCILWIFWTLMALSLNKNPTVCWSSFHTNTDSNYPVVKGDFIVEDLGGWCAQVRFSCRDRVICRNGNKVEIEYPYKWDGEKLILYSGGLENEFSLSY